MIVVKSGERRDVFGQDVVPERHGQMVDIDKAIIGGDEVLFIEVDIVCLFVEDDERRIVVVVGGGRLMG